MTFNYLRFARATLVAIHLRHFGHRGVWIGNRGITIDAGERAILNHEREDTVHDGSELIGATGAERVALAGKVVGVGAGHVRSRFGY